MFINFFANQVFYPINEELNKTFSEYPSADDWVLCEGNQLSRNNFYKSLKKLNVVTKQSCNKLFP